MNMMISPLRLTVLGYLLCAGAAAQDSMQLVDGRFVTGPRMVRSGEGVTLHYHSGEILVPAALVKSAAVSENSGDVVEVSAADRERLDQGLVNFEGKWMQPTKRDQLVEKRTESVKARIAEAMAHAKWNNHYKDNSKYFEFHYTIDPDILADWSELMDVYYKTFSKYWGNLRPPRGFGRLEVKFYHNHDYYDQVTGMRGTGGYFRFVPPLELNFYYDRLDHEWTMNVMFHETNHYLVWLIAPKYKMPTWISEGLAEYYGASVWDPETKTLELNGILEGRLANVQQDIRNDNWMGCEELLRTSHQGYSGRHYAWGWTFIHFLMNDRNYAKRLKRLVRALPKESADKRPLSFPGWNMSEHTPDASVKLAMKYLKVTDLTALEKEWHEYIKQLAPASGHGYFKFGESALGDGMPIKATRQFETAIEKGYESPMLYVRYAEALWRRPKKNRDARVADLREALVQFDKALELDPVNPLIRASYARMLNRAAVAKEEPDPEVSVQRELARELSETVNGGQDSYSVYLSLDWDVYDGK